MNMTNLSKTQKLIFSSLIIALYVVVLYFTQSFSFGAYQIRIATSLYALSYLFPFLVLPLGLANLLSNLLFGGLGLLDMFGGCFVGMLTTYLIVCIKKGGLSKWFMLFPIILGPGLLVPIWLSYLLNTPYSALAINLCIGQIIPAVVGVLLIQSLEQVIYRHPSQSASSTHT